MYDNQVQVDGVQWAGAVDVTWQPIEAALVAYALTATGVTIYPNHVPQRVTTPTQTIYSLLSESRPKTLEGSIGVVEASFQLDTYSPTKSDALVQAETLRLALDNFWGQWDQTEILGCFLELRLGGYEAPPDKSDKGSFRETQRYNVVYREVRASR